MPNFLALVFIMTFATHGHECPRAPSVQIALDRSAAVFAGEVVGEEYRDVNTDSMGKPATAKALVIKIKIEKVWKGDMGEEVYLYTSERKNPDGTSSVNAEDFWFHKGERYLVYAFIRDGHLQTNGCGRTRKLAEAEVDLRELGEGELPKRRG